MRSSVFFSRHSCICNHLGRQHEEKQATITIRDGVLQVQDGLHGEAHLRVTADSETWLGVVAKERKLVWALLRRRIRVKGPLKLLAAFGKCFPS